MSHWESHGQSDEWYTPPHVFEALGVTFDMDVAAPEKGGFVPAKERICADSLNRVWKDFVWMNAPFGGRNGLVPWLDKFFRHGNGIALTPDRTSAPWFRSAWPRADLIMFTPKLKFIRPDGSKGLSPSVGTALFGVGKKAVEAIGSASASGLGIVAIPGVFS